MTQVKHSINDEDEFMKGLLSGIDDSFFNAVPSPDPSPKKRKKYTEEFEEGSSTKKEQSPLRMSKDVLHRTPTRNSQFPRPFNHVLDAPQDYERHFVIPAPRSITRGPTT